MDDIKIHKLFCLCRLGFYETAKIKYNLTTVMKYSIEKLIADGWMEYE